MADPISIVSLIEGSLSLILQCASAAKCLHDIAEKYKKTRLTAMSMRQEVETVLLAWQRIKEWSQGHGEGNTVDAELLLRLEELLEAGTAVISTLHEDIAKYTRPETLSFIQRSKMAWNETILQDHQHRVRGQVIAVGLLLQVFQLGVPKIQAELFSKSHDGLRDSNSSSRSIVPSHMPSRLSGSTGTRDSNISNISVDLAYRPLRFENELFTARVYKRNYRNSAMFSGNSSMFPLSHKRARSSNGMLEDSKTSLSSDSTLLKILLTEEPNIHFALLKAVESRNVDYARVLLAHGARLSDPCSDSPWTNLHFAASRGDLKLTKFLLQACSDVTVHTIGGMQAIHVACKAGSLDVIQELHANGATIDCENDCGFQPLHIVANEISAPSVIRWLISKGANIDAQTKTAFKESALQLARRKSWLRDNVDVLRDLGAKETLESSPLRSPLHQAVLSRFHRHVVELLEEGADPNFRDAENGSTAILLFASAISDGAHEKTDDWTMFGRLLERGADIKAKDNMGNQVLHYLTKRTWYDKPHSTKKAQARRSLLTYLIESGADPNAINAEQETPLFLAIKHLNVPFVETVLRTGAGYLLPTEKLRLKIHLHGLKSQSYLHKNPTVLDPDMTLERDEEVDEILRLIRLLPENDMIEEVQSSGKVTMEEAQATANALRGRTQRRNSCPL